MKSYARSLGGKVASAPNALFEHRTVVTIPVVSRKQRYGELAWLPPCLGALVMFASPGLAAARSTDFGIRLVGATLGKPAVINNATAAPDVSSAARIAAAYGKITSTFRTAAHNRDVGGVRNSYHLRGQAIDVARRAGVSHARLATVLREAGYHLIESLDEGDHSHFALGAAQLASPLLIKARESTRWTIIRPPRFAISQTLP